MSAKKKWSDMSSKQRRMVSAAGAVQIGLMAAMNRDLSRRSDAELRGPRLLWRAASFMNYVGPVAYFLFGRRKK